MSKTIILELSQAKEMYGKNPEMDKLLLANFTKDELTKKDWRDITTLEAACKESGYSKEYMNQMTESPDVWAYRMLKMVCKALNQGWTPDWNNSEQNKYYSWLTVLPSGLGFSASGYGYSGTRTGVGSRLCLESSEKVFHLSKYFQELQKKFYL